MKQRKYTQDFETFYEVTFLSNEHEDFREEKPTTHTAIVYFDGWWFHPILIDGKPANGLAYRDAKTAVKNAWIINPNA